MNGYNCEKYVSEAIDSIFSQTFSDWEIIFIDNSSTDNTSLIVKSYGDKLKYHKTSENVSLGKARCIGLSLCNGEYVCFLDTDDIWFPSKLKDQLAIFKNSPEIKMVYTGVSFIDEHGDSIGKYIPKAKSGNVFNQQLKRYEINMQSVMVKNDIELKFDPLQCYSVDMGLFLWISSRYMVGVIPEILVKYRKHQTNLSHSCKEIEWKEQLNILNRIFDEVPSLKADYLKGYRLAHARVRYYKARYLISINNNKLARRELYKYRFSSFFYFGLYFLVNTSIPLWNLIHRKLREFS